MNDDVGKTKNLVLKKKRLKVNHKYDVIICIQLKIQIDGIPITVTTFHHSRSTPYWSTRTRTPNPEEKVVNKCNNNTTSIAFDNVPSQERQRPKLFQHW